MPSETLHYYAPDGIQLNVTVARFHVDRIDTVPPGPYYLENDRRGTEHQMSLRGPGEYSNKTQIATFNPRVMAVDESVAFKILGAMNQCETQSPKTPGK